MHRRLTRSGNHLLLAAAVTIAGLILLAGFGCNRDSAGLVPNADVALTNLAEKNPTDVSIEIISHTECKTSYSAVPSNQTAVEWEYDGDGTLNLHRINAGFNCCPEIFVEVDVVDRVIRVIERDAGQCFCLCLLDIDYQITGLSPGKYMLTFDEYIPAGDDEPLACEIILKGSGSSGSCAAERTHYPWVTQPAGELVNCELAPCTCLWPNSGCASWEYSEGTLSLTHCNEYTSCCILGEPTVDFDFSSNTIVITENVDMGVLALMVSVEIDMLISNLPPGEYLIKLNRFMDLEPVEFTVDLVNDPSGEVGFD